MSVQSTGLNPWQKLQTDEIGLLSFAFLDATDIVRMSAVCKRFQSMAAEPSLWRAQLKRRFAVIPKENEDPKKLYQHLLQQVKDENGKLEMELLTILQATGEKQPLPYPATLITELLRKYPHVSCVKWGYSNLMRAWDNIGPKTISTVCDNTRYLTAFLLLSLSATQHPAVTDQDLINLAKNHPELEKLTLQGCCNVSEDGILTVLNLLSGLRSLVLCNSNMLTKRVADKICELQFLETLTLRGTPKGLPPASLELIKSSCPLLKNLDFDLD